MISADSWVCISYLEYKRYMVMLNILRSLLEFAGSVINLNYHMLYWDTGLWASMLTIELWSSLYCALLWALVAVSSPSVLLQS